MTPPESNLLTIKQAADYLGVTQGTLYVWRATKRYAIPSVTLSAGYVRYRLQDLEKFTASRVKTPKVRKPRRTRKRAA